jgi:hypothetical protein
MIKITRKSNKWSCKNFFKTAREIFGLALNLVFRYDKNGLVYICTKRLHWTKKVTVHVIIEDKIGNIWIGYDRGIANLMVTILQCITKRYKENRRWV